MQRIVPAVIAVGVREPMFWAAECGLVIWESWPIWVLVGIGRRLPQMVHGRPLDVASIITGVRVGPGERLHRGVAISVQVVLVAVVVVALRLMLAEGLSIFIVALCITVLPVRIAISVVVTPPPLSILHVGVGVPLSRVVRMV